MHGRRPPSRPRPRAAASDSLLLSLEPVGVPFPEVGHGCARALELELAVGGVDHDIRRSASGRSPAMEVPAAIAAGKRDLRLTEGDDGNRWAHRLRRVARLVTRPGGHLGLARYAEQRSEREVVDLDVVGVGPVRAIATVMPHLVAAADAVGAADGPIGAPRHGAPTASPPRTGKAGNTPGVSVIQRMRKVSATSVPWSDRVVSPGVRGRNRSTTVEDGPVQFRAVRAARSAAGARSGAALPRRPARRPVTTSHSTTPRLA